MPEPASTRTLNDSATAGSRQTTSHSAAPANNRNGSARRWSNTRAPVQVTAKAVNSMALARSIEIISGAEPYRPNSMTEAARNRCANPHHATAVIAVFCTQANSSSNPRITST